MGTLDFSIGNAVTFITAKSLVDMKFMGNDIRKNAPRLIMIHSVFIIGTNVDIVIFKIILYDPLF